MTDVSIVIVNWNTKDILLECLRSISAQDGNFKKEVIVVDNGSTDGSQDAVRTAFPEAQIIENNTNLGFAKANNIGLLKSSGRYVCLVNSDVKMLDNSLPKLMNYMDQNLGIGIAGPKLLNPDLTLQNSCRKFPSLWNNLSPALCLNAIFKNSPFFSGEHMEYFKHDKTLHVDYLAGCVLFVRRKALNEVGLLDERFFIYSEEVDWCKRFKQIGWDIAFFPGAMAIHHHGVSSSKDPKRFALAHQKSFLQYWDKHHGYVSAAAIRLFLLLRYIIRLIPRFILYLLRPDQRAMRIMKIERDIACLSALILRNHYSS